MNATPETAETPSSTNPEELQRLYGTEDFVSAVNEAVADRRALGSLRTVLWHRGTLETWVPCQRARVLPELLLCTVLVAASIVGVWATGLSWHLQVQYNWVDPLFPLVALCCPVVLAACLTWAVNVVRKLKLLSGTEKAALAEWLSEHPYRRQLVSEWFGRSDNVLRIDRDAVMAVPTKHAERATQILIGCRDRNAQREDLQSTLVLRKG